MQIPELARDRYTPQIKAFIHIIRQFIANPDIQRILVVGCGPGYEAVIMQELLGCRVFGVDLNQQYETWMRSFVQLQNYDGIALPFKNNVFDAVYSFHVLEHACDPALLLAEISRVLKPGAPAYIGVPNRSRMLAYFGVRDKSFKSKLRQNIKDWQARLQGKFHNEFGAHAGFTQAELDRLMKKYYTRIYPVTHLYYSDKHPLLKPLLTGVFKLSLHKIMLPSLYIVGIK
ncbi:MAG TPA: class I SAM-dependent methyltransferase [bacterium]|nr:class I SAM-dependent methyltransferase [bacterium]HPN42416.1 class I SAM-dependent methyltransferase [bacterium]